MRQLQEKQNARTIETEIDSGFFIITEMYNKSG